MTHNTFSRERWIVARTHFVLDALILLSGVAVGAVIRFKDATPDKLAAYLPAVTLGALMLPSLLYGAGMYSDRVHLPCRYRLLVVFLCYMGAVVVMLSVGSLSFDSRLGRGVLLMSVLPTSLLLMLHHGFIMSKSLGNREKILLIVSEEADESTLHRLKKLNPPFMELVGVVDARNPPAPDGMLPKVVTGRFSELTEIVERLRVDCVLCTVAQLRHPELGAGLRRVSFSGARLVTLMDIMEEAFRLVPVGLVTVDWLLMASTLPHRSYVRKWKRLFDIVTSLTMGIVLLPILLFGMAWVKLVSPGGPVFFRQLRCGRLGRPFNLLKLRTMKVDAEADGPQWAKKNDSRVIFGGGWLRKFRVDEIPQLLNVLRGEMSFVGPRPERPEFEEKLAAEIPFFRERLLVAPGLTGWAQVRHPYGASVEDARRKLEYDLYYMKHMTVTFDMFILLDTARIVLGGGVKRNEKMESCMNEILVPPQREAELDLSAAATDLV